MMLEMVGPAPEEFFLSSCDECGQAIRSSAPLGPGEVCAECEEDLAADEAAAHERDTVASSILAQVFGP